VWEKNYNDIDIDEIKEKYGYGSLSRGEEEICTDAVMSDLDFSTMEVSRVIEQHSNIATGFAIGETENGEVLVIGCADSNIKVWSWDTEEIILTLQGHSAAVTCLDISEDGKTLISGSDDNTIIVWNFDNHQIIQTLQGHLSAIKSVAISSDDRTIFSQSDDNIIKVWRVR
ncbi:WD40 repeat domain-containing protein, partial [Phormidesmis priestleyi]